jgi:hypothetical protein
MFSDMLNRFRLAASGVVKTPKSAMLGLAMGSAARDDRVD